MTLTSTARLLSIALLLMAAPAAATVPAAVVAEVLGEPVRADQIELPGELEQVEALRGELEYETAVEHQRLRRVARLRELIVKPLMLEELRRQKIEPADEQIDAIIAWGRENQRRTAAAQVETLQRQLDDPDLSDFDRRRLTMRLGAAKRQAEGSRGAAVPLAEMTPDQRAQSKFIIDFATAALQTFNFHRWLHERSGGRLVEAREPHPEPRAVEAYMKWLDEMEKSGALRFHDQALRATLREAEAARWKDAPPATAEGFEEPWWTKPRGDER